MRGVLGLVLRGFDELEKGWEGGHVTIVTTQ